MPAMICAIRRNGKFVGIHRTYLDADGNKLNKMMLGDCKGGSVYLGGAGDPITISEGIENGLSCRQLLTSKIGTFLFFQRSLFSVSGIDLAIKLCAVGCKAFLYCRFTLLCHLEFVDIF
jgi:hypothetical protein